MKKLLLLLIVLISKEGIKSQVLPDMDSLVIKLSVYNEVNDWSYVFSVSNEAITVQGTDYYPGCYDKRVGVHYPEKMTRKYVLYDENLINPQTNVVYTKEIIEKAKSIFCLNSPKEDTEYEPTYDTVWHFSLYKDGYVIGYYYFDSTVDLAHNHDFVGLYGILYQIKRYRCRND